jgi:hypothetical protein
MNTLWDISVPNILNIIEKGRRKPDLSNTRGTSMKPMQPPRLFRLKPRTALAFQWLPDDPDFTYPKWFEDMVVTGRAYAVQNGNERHISLSNKRGEYKGLVGDWICKDEYGHIFVVSQSTFHERYVSDAKDATPPHERN